MGQTIISVDEIGYKDTFWDDMVGDLFGRRLNSTVGKVDYNWDENAIKFQSGGSIGTKADRVQSNTQIMHKGQTGNITIYPHIHWFQDVASGAYTLNATFTLRYRVQHNGQAKTTSWTDEITTTGTLASDMYSEGDLFDFTGEADGTYNQLNNLQPITISGANVSDTVQFMLARTDSNVGDALVYFMDFHYAINSPGSRGIVSK